MSIVPLILAVLLVALGCGDEPAENNVSTNNSTTAANNANNNDDPTCQTPCPAGEVQEFGECTAADCTARIACGEEVMCRNQQACLAGASCADGGLLLESCPADLQGCLPTMVCGVTKYCVTLQQCAHDACDAGESASALACGDPAITLPCRETPACGNETVACVCRAEDILCEDEETFSTNPCQGGEMCREVMACGDTFYCKGGSISG